MKNFFLTIITTVATLALSVFLVWNFLPISWLDYLSLPKEINFGVALTTINNSDKISSLPTTLNANFNALNAGFTGVVDVATTSMESLASTTNLVAVGTLITGTWNASTLTVSYGGTSSTTLAIGQLLLGSSTNAISMVDGFGTTGQFLTSNGADTKPTWQTSAVDQTLAYQWTGIHNFTTNAYFTNFNASSTLVLGGLSLSFPTTNGASSTVLKTDGAGNLTFGYQDWETIVSTTTEANMERATTTIPTGFRDLKITIYSQGISGSVNSLIYFNQDAGQSPGYSTFGLYQGITQYTQTGTGGIQITNGATTSPMLITATLTNLPTANKFLDFRVISSLSGSVPQITTGGGLYADATNEISTIHFYSGSASQTITSGTTIFIQGHR